MQERKPGCICELNEQGDPVVLGYAMCPVHKPDAPNPEYIAAAIFKKHFIVSASSPSAIASFKITVDEILSVLSNFKSHPQGEFLIELYEEVKNSL